MRREQYSPARKGESVRVACLLKTNRTCLARVFLRLITMLLADLLPKKLRDKFDKSAQPKPPKK